jgi:hypothetical protein
MFQEKNAVKSVTGERDWRQFEDGAVGFRRDAGSLSRQQWRAERTTESHRYSAGASCWAAEAADTDRVRPQRPTRQSGALPYHRDQDHQQQAR